MPAPERAVDGSTPHVKRGTLGVGASAGDSDTSEPGFGTSEEQAVNASEAATTKRLPVMA